MTLNPLAHAPYGTVEQYILDWTELIWAEGGIGSIPGMYHENIIVRGASGVSTGVAGVVRGSLAKKASFIDRIGVGEDVIWETRGESSFVSHHRVLHSGGQSEVCGYGPALGLSAVSRNLPVCLVVDGLVTEEWVVRDEWAVVAGLGHDPVAVASAAPVDLAPLGVGGLFGRPAPLNPVVSGDSGPRPAEHVEEAEFLLALWRDVIQARRFDRVADFYSRDSIVHTSRNRTVTRVDGVRADLLNFVAPFPDATVEVRDIAVHSSASRGVRASVLWRLTGTYSGLPLYGQVTGSPVEIMGVSQYEFEAGRVRQEYRIFDEVAVLAQIEAARQH